MEYLIPEEQEGQRLDSAIAGLSGLSRSRVAALIEAGHVRANSQQVRKPSQKAIGGESISVDLPPAQAVQALPQDIPLEILYEDEDLAVINKPRGMVVHPAPGNPDGTLVNALLYHLRDLSGLGGELRPGIVHRLDKDTTGVMVVAKNDYAHQGLSEQFARRTMQKEYLALLRGNLRQDAGSVEAPIGRHPGDRKKMAVRPQGREALTKYRVLRRYRGACLVACQLLTGRTHQIRVHMAHLGHPVLEDPLYGGKGSGQLLHAWRICFTHPRSGALLRFSARPDEQFLCALRKYERQRK